MKILRTTVLLSSALLLVACASTQESASYQQSRFTKYRYVQDTAYVKQYEQTAQRRAFVRVHWVHPPMKRVAILDNDAE